MLDIILSVLSLLLFALVIGLLIILRRAQTAAADRERAASLELLEARSRAAAGDEVRRGLGEAQQAAQTALARTSQAERDQAAAQAEVLALRSFQRQQEERIQQLEQEVGRERQLAHDQHAAATKDRDTLHQDLAKVQADLAEARTQVAQGRDLHQQVLAAEQVRDEAVRRAADAEAQKAALQAEMAGVRERERELDGRLASEQQASQRLREEHLRATTEMERLRGELRQALALAEERQRSQSESREQMITELKLLSQQLLQDQGKALLGEGKTQIEQVISPMRERLSDFAARVDAIHATDVKERATLQQELKGLMEAQGRLTTEAAELGKALRSDTQAQGTWGELTLERLLEASQLERGLAYDLQVGVRSDEGSPGRPDAVIFLPDNKVLVVDAKVSLTAFVRAQSATDPAERALALAAHAASVRQHVRDLAKRSYPEAVKGNALDLTLLFMPSEPAFAAACAADPNLWADAWKANVVVLSPSTLLACLRVVAQIWRVEKHNRNAADIARQAGLMLDKFRGFLEDLDTVGKRIQDAHAAYDQARQKLSTGRGNLIKRSTALLQLGAHPKDATAARIRLDSGEVGDDDDQPVSEDPPA